MEAPQNLKIRKIKNIAFKSMVVVFAFASTIPLFLIFFHIFREGISAIDFGFFVNLPKPVGEPGGGIANALLGTILLVLMACLISLPVGIGVGIYLSETRESRLVYWVRMCVDVLQGVPSIVIGIIAYLWVVKPMGIFSAFSGSIALAMMMLPVVIRSSEETLRLVPHTLKEASLSLGAPYYLTLLKVVLPAGFNGIVTGVLISVARIAGETAPLLFTAFGNPFMNANVMKPIASLPLIIFNYAISPYPDWHSLAWGASLVLIMMVLALNLIAKFISRKWRVEF